MNANGRRQRQAINKYGHLAPMRRPHYKVWNAAASKRRLDLRIETENRIRQSGGKKKDN